MSDLLGGASRVTDEQAAKMMARGATPIMKYFKYDHLPEPLKAISKPIAVLAETYDTTLPDGPEKSAGLRKLLEAKDCFVRAAL